MAAEVATCCCCWLHSCDRSNARQGNPFGLHSWPPRIGGRAFARLQRHTAWPSSWQARLFVVMWQQVSRETRRAETRRDNNNTNNNEFMAPRRKQHADNRYLHHRATRLPASRSCSPSWKLDAVNLASETQWKAKESRRFTLNSALATADCTLRAANESAAAGCQRRATTTTSFALGLPKGSHGLHTMARNGTIRLLEAALGLPFSLKLETSNRQQELSAISDR